MLDNTIVLSVNEDNDDGTTPAVDITYSRQVEAENRSEYVASDHTSLTRNKLGFYRTFPKKNGNYRGSEKVSAKFTEDKEVPSIVVDEDISSPFILEVNSSCPVGVTDADKLAMRMRMAAWLMSDEATSWHNQQQI
jgi:hypothetical protein